MAGSPERRLADCIRGNSPTICQSGLMIRFGRPRPRPAGRDHLHNLARAGKQP